MKTQSSYLGWLQSCYHLHLMSISEPMLSYGVVLLSTTPNFIAALSPLIISNDSHDLYDSFAVWQTGSQLDPGWTSHHLLSQDEKGNVRTGERTHEIGMWKLTVGFKTVWNWQGGGTIEVNYSPYMQNADGHKWGGSLKADTSYFHICYPDLMSI